MIQPCIVAFEGLDGCGKTTIASRVAARLVAPCISLPPPILKLAGDALMRMPASRARYLYYLSAVAVVSEQVESGDLHIFDRHLASAHALHEDVDLRMRRHLSSIPIRFPHLTILLQVAEPERLARLEMRGRPLDPFEQRLATDDVFRAKVLRRLESGPNTCVVETTGRSIAEVVADSATLIKSHHGACQRGF
jgi:thymidylate kinase